ncbi:hypothetical protein [Desulfonatronovibrio hydrogenovorans]|nr:hypothetical protein [Desulfonatronovibrio hydrogenovorans]
MNNIGVYGKNKDVKRLKGHHVELLTYLDHYVSPYNNHVEH